MILDLLLAVLAAWRISALLVYEDWFLWLRQRAEADFDPPTLAGRILGCFWCMTLLAGVLAYVLLVFKVDWLLYPLAISGGAIILNHWTRIVRDAER